MSAILRYSLRSERTICSDDSGVHKQRTLEHEKAQIGAYQCPKVLAKPIHAR